MDSLLMKTNPPPLVYYDNREQYKIHYIEKYVKNRIVTFDGIDIKFTIDRFNHAFYKASIPGVTHKDIFDTDRAERIDWIEYALTSGLAKVFLKNDSKRKRLHIILDYYIVVLNMHNNNAKKAFFITAYIADSEKHMKKLQENELIYLPK